ncbi:MAG TPA: DUF1611 domain-containing protein [Woeseiaceae bacterium]|nr:DUF1611 domain-containing protein [Woeseiaceae bacterium]
MRRGDRGSAAESVSTGTPGLVLPQPYLLFLADATEARFAKTAFGLRDWAGGKCIGEFGIGATVTTGLPHMTPAEACEAGARSLVIGVAGIGGSISEHWVPPLVEAMHAGLHIISGMHSRLGEVPELAEAAERTGRRLIDVRFPPEGLPVATGRKRSGKRLLTVGTDCALGKKYTALAIANAFNERGIPCTFRATGQTGIMIAGSGIPMDSVVSDFAAGAAEALSPDAAPGHWDIIEGQGSLSHPIFAAVSLGLLHGSQPDVIVVCHEPGRTEMLGTASYALPSIEETIELNLRLGGRTNPHIRCAGISMNTSKLRPEEAEDYMAAEAERLGLPVADPMRGGQAFETLIESCLG